MTPVPYERMVAATDALAAADQIGEILRAFMKNFGTDDEKASFAGAALEKAADNLEPRFLGLKRAIVVTMAADNPSRTVADIKEYFSL